MHDRETHERNLAKLLEVDTTHIKAWLDSMRAFAKDSAGRTIILGLTAAETLEFLTLNEAYYADRDGGLPDANVRRYHELREKHDVARAKDASENLAHWSAGAPKTS